MSKTLPDQLSLCDMSHSVASLIVDSGSAYSYLLPTHFHFPLVPSPGFSYVSVLELGFLFKNAVPRPSSSPNPDTRAFLILEVSGEVAGHLVFKKL